MGEAGTSQSSNAERESGVATEAEADEQEGRRNGGDAAANERF